MADKKTMTEVVVRIPAGCKIQIPQDAEVISGEVHDAYCPLTKAGREPFEMVLLKDTELGNKGDHIEVDPLPLNGEKGAYELVQERIAAIVYPEFRRTRGAGLKVASNSKVMLTENIPGLGLAADFKSLSSYETGILGKLVIPERLGTTYQREIAMRKRPDYKPPQPSPESLKQARERKAAAEQAQRNQEGWQALAAAAEAQKLIRENEAAKAREETAARLKIETKGV